MNVEKNFSRAVKLFQNKNYNDALKILDKIKRYAPSFRKAYMLEVDIWRDLGNPIKELKVLEKALTMFNLNDSEDQNMATPGLFRLGYDLSCLGMNEESIKNFCIAAKYANNKNLIFMALSSAIYMGSYTENFSAADMRTLYDEYKKYFVDIVPYQKNFYNHKKIRIGFLSADFCKHPVMHWSWALFVNLDKNLFEACYYSNTKTPDELTEHLRSISDIWRDIFSLSDEEAAKVIRDDEIDIFFDLNGHTSGNRLRVAAYHPASVQISGIGYIDSTGLDAIDYFLSDVYCAGNLEYFTEKVIKMPHSHICYEPPSNIEPAPAPPCIKNNFVTFGSFNQFRKMTDSMLTTWKKILDAVPNSRLILKHKIFNIDDGKNFVCERLKSLGFDLSRVEMRGFSKNHLAEYADIDIALDTFPYTGGVTTCEALYMGVPVISLYGDRHGTRFGLSILSNVGLGELAVDSYDEYIKRAAALAGDWELLTILRKNLRTMMEKSPLMDAESYVRDIETAFVKILSDERENFLNG